jgi:hypothetical protein
LITSQVPAPLSTKHAAHSAHTSSRDLWGSDSPQAHRPPSMGWIYAHQVPWLLLRKSTPRGPMSHLLDEVGRHGSACHNSSARCNSPCAINRLCKALAGGTHLEATTPSCKEAPRRPLGLCQLPRWSNLTPRSMGTRAAHPQNQPTPRSWVGSR